MIQKNDYGKGSHYLEKTQDALIARQDQRPPSLLPPSLPDVARPVIRCSPPPAEGQWQGSSELSQRGSEMELWSSAAASQKQ